MMNRIIFGEFFSQAIRVLPKWYASKLSQLTSVSNAKWLPACAGMTVFLSCTESVYRKFRGQEEDPSLPRIKMKDYCALALNRIFSSACSNRLKTRCLPNKVRVISMEGDMLVPVTATRNG